MLDPRSNAVPRPPSLPEPEPPARRASWRRRLASRTRTGHRLVALRDEVRARLAEACAVERRPPERYGFSPDAAAWLFTVTGALYRWYFRTQCHGIERLPRGPVMLVANHGSHALAWDGANLVTACLLEARPARLLHGMAEHRLMTLPVLGRAARRIGAVDGQRETCTNLLAGGAAVLAFPEGVKALERRFSQRYQLRPFGHGFVHVALAARVPIVPVAIIGGEEEAPLLANPHWLRRLLRTPTAPLTPTLFVPLPVRYRIHFGVPYYPTGPATPQRVARHVEHVRGALAEMIERGREAREHIFY